MIHHHSIWNYLEFVGICGDMFDENVYFLMDCLDKFVYLFCESKIDI